MNSNGFFKLAVFSLVGIFISAVILTFTSSIGQNGMNMQSGNTMSNMQGSNMSTQGNMNAQGSQSNSLSNIEYQLQMMEKQIIQIQQYIQNGNMNNSSQQNSNMNNSNSAGSSSMPMPAPAADPAPMPMM